MRPSETTIRTGLATALGGVAGVVLAAIAVVGVVSRTSLFATTLDEAALYRLAVPALAAELAESDVVARTNAGPLELTRDDVQEILAERFDPGDVSRKAREVHRGLLEYVRRYPRDSIFEVSIRRERPVLARAAEQRVVERFLALPDCDPGTDLEVLGRAGVRSLLDGTSDEDFLRSLPPCRPPDPVAEDVVEGIRAEFRSLRLEGPDSVEVFPDPSTADWTAHSARMRRVQAVERFLGRWGWVPALGVLLGLGAVAGAGRRRTVLPDGRLLLEALGAGLLATALLLWLDGAPRTVLMLFGAEPAGDPLHRMWFGLGEHGVRRTLERVASLFAPAGAVLLAGGLAGRLVRWRSKRATGPPSRPGGR